jgi:hypothetical protein
MTHEHAVRVTASSQVQVAVFRSQIESRRITVCTVAILFLFSNNCPNID